MNRRCFVAGVSLAVAGWPLVAQTTPEPMHVDGTPTITVPVQAFASRGFAFNGMANQDQLASLHILVEQFADRDQAHLGFDERVRNVPIPEAPLGEFSLVDQDVVKNIDGYFLPVFLTTYSVIAGAAAVVTSYATAITQRDRHIWTVHASSGHGNDRMSFIRSMMEPLLWDLVAQEIESSEIRADDDGISHGGLWDLLPTPAELPNPMQMTTQDASTPELGEPVTDPD